MVLKIDHSQRVMKTMVFDYGNTVYGWYGTTVV